MTKKQIYLTEKQIDYIKKHLLTENRESKNMSKARNLLYQQGYSQEDAQKTIEAIRNDIPNARLADCKFLPGVTRMYLNRELSDGNTIMKLNKTLKYVASDAHVNEYDNNLNGLSVNELVERFAGVQQQDADASRAESYGKEFTRNNAYTIVRIPDAETAAEYGKYTSWCVTHDKNMYNSYTNDGTGLFYFCLRNGFENERPNVGENCPLDSYGLSMIAVSVTMEGELNTCTCRWNHDNGGNDNIMDKNQLEELLGVNFYEAFKPYSREELHAKGKILFDEVPELLAQGKKPTEIFDNVRGFYNGYASVQLNNKWNFINTSGKLLSPNQWFDYVSDFFEEGYAKVYLNGKCNLINSNNGELIFPNQWFDNIYYLNYNYAEVYLNGKCNLINTNNYKLLSPNQWFDKIFEPHEGYAVVRLNDKCNLINTNNGELLSPNQWFDRVEEFYNGCAIVVLNNKYNLLNNKYNFINTNGDLLWNKPVNKWFDNVDPFFNGYAWVLLNDEWYYLRSDGVLCDYNTKEPLANQQMVSETKKIKRIYLTESQVEEIKKELEKARKETNTNPTEGQKEAGNYKMGRVNIHGLDIAIENPKGSYRRGKDRDGKEWKCLMHNDYGYFSHTLGKDGDAVDVFIGNNLDSKSIFAIDQKIDGKFDETKVMLGFNTAEEAKKAYLSNYEKDWKGFWKITEVTIEDFKKWLYNGFRQRKPFSEYQEIKKKKLNESKNNNKLLMESSIEEYFYEYDCESILNQFVVDMRNGVTVQNWKPLINPAMYQKALQIFTKQGDLDGFPEKYIYQWIGILMRNTIQLDSNTELAGHSMGIDCDALDNSAIGGYIKEKLGFEVIDWDDNCTLSVSPQYIINDLLHTRGLSEAEKEYIDEYLKNNPLNEDAVHQIGPNKGQTAMFLSQPELDYYDNEYMVKTRDKDLQGIVDIYNYHNGGEQDSRVLISSEGNQAKIGENGNILLTMDVFRLLDMVGLYDWMQMPDGSDAWSDFGLRPLFEILSEYDDNKTPEETLVIINKALDITHQRGDMPSIFIEGGSSTLSQITHSTYLTESYLLDWEKEQIEDNSVNGTIKLYHNTTNQNLNDIINDGELDTHQHHSEGHGHMLFFTVNPNAWGVQSKISIEVPIKDFEDMTFRFVNNDSVITENNVPINQYNFKIENVKGLEYDRIIEILTGNDERLKNYLLSDFFADIPSIAEWFFNKIDYNF